MATKIRRWVETDTGHRVPNHSSKCRNMHGHRYRWEAELEGDVVTDVGASEEGMLENLAKWAFELIEPHISSAYGNILRLHSFHVRETPKSWATWSP